MGDSIAGESGVITAQDKATGGTLTNGPNNTNAAARTTNNKPSSPSKDRNGNPLDGASSLDSESPSKKHNMSDSEKNASLLGATNGEGDHSKASPEHFSTADEGEGGDDGGDDESDEDSFLSRETAEDGQSDLESEDPDEMLGLSDGDGEVPRMPHMTIQRNRKANPELPETVTVLKTDEGCVVYLVGTAHFSLESQEDVAKTIQETQPDVVLIELCKSRVNILSFDEELILKESQSMNMEKMMSTIKQNGLVQGIMYILLLSMSAHLTRQLGMAPGGEFRRAVQEAEKVKGCLIHLGDRPLQITLQRALAALSVWQKLRLAWHMITAKEPISKEEVERCKKQDLLEEMLAEMTGEFPALSKVFVKERDVFLAYSLRLAASPMPSMTTPSGEQPTVVVGVVGIGHVPGIVENWETVTDSDIPPIMRIPGPSLSSKVLKHTIKVSLLSLAVWGCWKLLPSTVTHKPIEWVSALYRH
ncbi:traB domain-containing protein [Ixodes scapularis]|uniref:traB domain-containing protein n=1 Tax=Ixodes scapularis TaxID=6945 RepID=UPI001C38F66B|nr:traB domain-containing protein [Ixodes scapularis]